MCSGVLCWVVMCSYVEWHIVTCYMKMFLFDFLYWCVWTQMFVTELWRTSSAFSFCIFWFSFLRCVEYVPGLSTLQFWGQKITRPWRTILSGFAGSVSFFVPLPSRAISHARGHLRISRFARRTTEKREAARSLGFHAWSFYYTGKRFKDEEEGWVVSGSDRGEKNLMGL